MRGTCASLQPEYPAALAGALSRDFSGTENTRENCQLCWRNYDEALVGARVGGQQRKHIGSRAASPIVRLRCCTDAQLASAAPKISAQVAFYISKFQKANEAL